MDYKDDISKALSVLEQGGVIVYPTDTVWGIGCDATSREAVERVYRIKERADSKALISLVGSIAQLERVVGELPEAAEMLLEVAVDPITIIYDRPIGLAPNLLAPDGSAAIRVASDRFCRDLCARFRRPIVSTSANISGRPTPANFAEITPEVLSQADYVVAYRRDDTTPHRPSSVVKIASDNTIKIIRK